MAAIRCDPSAHSATPAPVQHGCDGAEGPRRQDFSRGGDCLAVEVPGVVVQMPMSRTPLVITPSGRAISITSQPHSMPWAIAPALIDCSIISFNVQQKPDGSFPQNSWVDGRPIGNGLQMDQMAWPLLLAYQLKRQDKNSWLKHIKPAADFILSRGPRTDQDRWEEKPGYSPAAIAAQIAGLVCAAEIAKLNGDKPTSEKYLATADNWAGNVNWWTVTREGHISAYYVRITENNDPNDEAKMEINSSSRIVEERKVLDAGFLELVRLGIKKPGDPIVVRSLKIIDRLIKVKTPVGDAWYRYNHDAYGETPDGGNYDARTGIGRLWTLLTGERGEYELAAGNVADARKMLATLAGFANDGLMIPEQVWDREESPSANLRFGAGTGSATPLAWSMAQFIRLAMSIERGRNIETPRIVWERYGSRG